MRIECRYTRGGISHDCHKLLTHQAFAKAIPYIFKTSVSRKLLLRAYALTSSDKPFRSKAPLIIPTKLLLRDSQAFSKRQPTQHLLYIVSY